MRTTLILNDELAVAAKRMAAERRVSLSQVVNEALRRELAELRSRTSSSRIAIPVFDPLVPDRPDTAPTTFDALQQDDFPQSR